MTRAAAFGADCYLSNNCLETLARAVMQKSILLIEAVKLLTVDQTDKIKLAEPV